MTSKKDKNNAKLLRLIVLFFLIIIILVSFSIALKASQNEDRKIQESLKSVHVELGVPQPFGNASDKYIYERMQYVFSYNPTKGQSNWVCWNLNPNWYGKEKRFSGKFKTDPLLGDSIYAVKHDDYTNSGYDRGHLVRSKERTKSEEDNLSTFYMTNIIPQTPDLNRGVWLSFENFIEKLCITKNKEMYLVAGGIFKSDETLSNAKKVVIPDSCYKIVVVLNKGEGLENVNENTIVFAVVMPNVQGIRSESWEKYQTTVRRIENSTGYDFHTAVSKSIQDAIETKIYKP